MIVLTYLNDCIIVGPSIVDIFALVHSMKNVPVKFVLTDKGGKKNSLALKLPTLMKRYSKYHNIFFINRTVSLFDIDTNDYGTNTNTKSATVGKTILQKELSGKPRKEAWNYQAEVGMINHLQGMSRPEISMAVHQTAGFCNNPMLSHKKSINYHGRYLLHTKKEFIICNPEISKGLECCVDAEFAGG